MKFNKYIALGAVAAAMTTTGCTDSFLEVESPNDPSIREYINSDARVQETVVAAYDPMHWTDWAMNEYNPYMLMSDIMADDLWVGGSDRTDNANWHYMMNFEAQPNHVIAGLWTDAYSGVKRCNDVMDYIYNLEIPDMTDEAKKYYEAQVRVLRVFYYNWLWKFWGNVVYFDKNFDGAPYLGTQYSADEVYGFMIEDLETAIALNALPMKEDDADLGRVTQAMAYMLYAEIVMYQNDQTRYGKALDYMKAIMNGGYSLNPDYTNIFKEEGEWSDESIYEINYKDDNAIRDWGNPLAAGGTVLPTLISPNGWSDGADGHNSGWGFCPVRQETYDRYAEGDSRRDATCWNAAAVGIDYNKRYQDTGLFLEKYVAQAGGNADQKASSELNYNNNWRVYRYSETLLNAAELVLRGAGSGDAQGWLDQVRKRAGVASVPATLDNVIEERHLEFVGEGKRYWDLIRTGMAPTVLVPDSYGYRTNTWSASKKYLPIPQSEIDKARGSLTQNNY